MIDLKALMDKARQSKNRVAVTAYQSVHERTLRAMSIPGPKKGKPLTQKQIVGLIHDEIKDRRDSSEFMAPSQSGYADNQHIVKMLSKLLPG